VPRLDEFLAEAGRAYYAARDPFADFATAPELSQAFGECLGLWAALAWEGMGRPSPVLLAEAGPGRGTLMADALRAVAELAPAFHDALSLHLIETSPRLREAQRARLPDATWHESLATLPDGPLILLANEFLDALPIRQFVRRDGAWRERWVEDGAFVERDAPDPPQRDAPEGAVCERGEAARAFVAALAQRGATALFLDYGPAESALGDSLQAMREGRPADPLAEPGTVDVTAHVDFAALAVAARVAGAAVHGPLPQGVFLARLGLHARSAALAAANPRRAPALLAAAHRLTAPEAMGRLFKALALTHPAAPPPPGFDP
jgi:NADH dehydrogenase [ubiquinone] 1 alpha subcomplex assembly factor 7